MSLHVTQGILEQFLLTQLDYSTFSDAAEVDSAPCVTPAEGHALLEKFADMANSLTVDSGVSDVATWRQLRRVLKLASVLWGPLSSDDTGVNVELLNT